MMRRRFDHLMQVLAKECSENKWNKWVDAASEHAALILRSNRDKGLLTLLVALENVTRIDILVYSPPKTLPEEISNLKPYVTPTNSRTISPFEPTYALPTPTDLWPTKDSSF